MTLNNQEKQDLITEVLDVARVFLLTNDPKILELAIQDWPENIIDILAAADENEMVQMLKPFVPNSDTDAIAEAHAAQLEEDEERAQEAEKITPPGSLRPSTDRSNEQDIPTVGAEDATEADRFNTGKPKLSMLMDFPQAIIDVVSVLDFGAQKYGRNNWKLGMPMSETTDSLLRHLLSFHNGGDFDAESLKPELAHIICNALMMLQNLHTHGQKFDDRDKQTFTFHPFTGSA